MDARLAHAIDRIAGDRRSGAAELALAATDALLEWTRRRPRPAGAELENLARALLRAQPAMAPLLRLANEVALAMDAPQPAGALGDALRRFRGILTRGPGRIARHFRRCLAGQRTLVATYSCSSTVLAALKAARQHIAAVYCSEGRPALEGRRTATELAGAGIQVLFLTDADLLSGFGEGWWKHLVVGADAILPAAFLNKSGTRTLSEIARRSRARVWVLAESTKFLPGPLARLQSSVVPGEGSRPPTRARRAAGAPLWLRAPKGVVVIPPGFEATAYWPGLRVVTEAGVLTPAGVRPAMKHLRISPRLEAPAR